MLCAVMTLSLVVMTTMGVPISDHAPPDISNISATIACNVCADAKPFLAIVIVSSHSGNQEKRECMRNTFPAKEIEALGFRRIFVLARLENETEPNKKYKSISDAAIIQESDKYGDIMRINQTEGYRRLIWKMNFAYRFVVEECSQARFMVHLDDDVFCNYCAVAKMLEALAGDEVDTIRGHTNYNEDVGYFIAGPFYSTSLATLRRIVDVANVTRPNIYLDDDCFFTRETVDAIGARRADEKQIRGWFDPRPHCFGNGSVFRSPTSVFANPGPFPAEKAVLFKMHGLLCCNGNCDEFSEQLLQQPGITCFQ